MTGSIRPNGPQRRTSKQPSRAPGDRPGPGDQPGLAARKAAARLLAAVVDAGTSLDGLTDHEHGHPQFRALDMRDRALVRAILATALRFRITIGGMLEARLDKALPPNATALGHILNVAAAQILFLDVPDSAAVDLAVTHAGLDPRTARFAALVNGVLRNLARAKEAELAPALAASIDAPAWFMQRLSAAYGEETARRIAGMHRVEAPTDFTVRSDPEGWAARLGGVVLPNGSVRVERLSGPVPELPGYAEGSWWVQDAAAALPARLFGDISGARVADLCAAPGGKTAQLALAGARVTAVDASGSRLARMDRNLARLGLAVETVHADIMGWEPPSPFDAVLLDAPCSSTGTVRRHPDVPWVKSEADIGKLAAVQSRLLLRAIGMVRPGGLLVFSNCSLDPEEGERLIEAVLAADRRIRMDPVEPGELPVLDPWITASGTLRTTPADLDLGRPGISGMDGFFAARLRREG